jgi:hypothetical protein
MQGEDKKRWQVLCEQTVKEQDAVKLFALIQEFKRSTGCSKRRKRLKD